MATTYFPAKFQQPVHACEFGNRVVFVDKVDPTDSVLLALADKINLVKVPNGTLVDRVVISNPDLDTSGASLAVKLGFAPTDGSAAPASMADADVAVAAIASTWQGAAVTTYEIFPPYRLDTECYLQAVVTTASAGITAGAKTIYAKVEGEPLGQK